MYILSCEPTDYMKQIPNSRNIYVAVFIVFFVLRLFIWGMSLLNHLQT